MKKGPDGVKRKNVFWSGKREVSERVVAETKNLGLKKRGELETTGVVGCRVGPFGDVLGLSQVRPQKKPANNFTGGTTVQRGKILQKPNQVVGWAQSSNKNR